MRPYQIAALMLLGWDLIIPEPNPRTAKTGFLTSEACEKAADEWRATYKRNLQQAN